MIRISTHQSAWNAKPKPPKSKRSKSKTISNSIGLVTLRQDVSSLQILDGLQEKVHIVIRKAKQCITGAVKNAAITEPASLSNRHVATVVIVIKKRFFKVQRKAAQ